MSKVTTATPSSSSTSATSPTRTPATRMRLALAGDDGLRGLELGLELEGLLLEDRDPQALLLDDHVG